MEQRMDDSATYPRASRRQGELRSIWIALLIVSGFGSSFFFACATPVAAVATLASLRLDRREAAAVVGLVWLANQAIGYGILGYAWTLDSAAWGIAIGLSGYLALLAAAALTPVGPARLAISLPFMAAFAAYQLSLYVAGFVLPGAEGAFTAPIVAQVFVVNLIALIGLLAVYQLTLAFQPSRREHIRPHKALLPR
jgi:hypothetical protein